MPKAPSTIFVFQKKEENICGDTAGDCIISCGVSIFGKLRFCRSYQSDRLPFSKVSTLESVSGKCPFLDMNISVFDRFSVDGDKNA